jgi:hypothetical protein
VGTAYSLGVLGLLSIGVFVLPVALIGTFWLRRRRESRSSAPGVVSGAGLPMLYVAFINRDGPGWVCEGTGCGQQLSPWPWLIAGVLFLGAGVAGYLLLPARRRAGRVTGPGGEADTRP